MLSLPHTVNNEHNAHVNVAIIVIVVNIKNIIIVIIVIIIVGNSIVCFFVIIIIFFSFFFFFWIGFFNHRAHYFIHVEWKCYCVIGNCTLGNHGRCCCWGIAIGRDGHRIFGRCLPPSASHHKYVNNDDDDIERCRCKR